MRSRFVLTILLGTLLLLAATGCPDNSGDGGSSGGGLASRGSSDYKGLSTFSVVSGSENKQLEPIVTAFGEQHGVNVEMHYKGSVDIMLELEQGSQFPYDAVWPANSLWISIGDVHDMVKHSESIMRSPVVFGVKQSIARDLGWFDTEVSVDDILGAAESGRLRFGMTSATQSNSGASAYMGYLYAFAGQPDVLTSEHLADAGLRDKIRRILGSVNRSSGSSGWLKELFIEQYDRFDAMVNYEALVIEANQELIGMGREPLYCVYPVDGLALADSPLGYVDKDDDTKEQFFFNLQEHLLSEPVQDEILSHGRRTGLVGMNPEDAPRDVFRSEWGIDLSRNISPIVFPKASVIREALDLYQVAFRKPSFTIFALDFSGSMEGEGAAELKRAMRTLLDKDEAAKYLLQPSDKDVTIVLPFNHELLGEWRVDGNAETDLDALLAQIERQVADGGTDIYLPVMRGLEIIKREGLERAFPAVILLSDGVSNNGSFPELRTFWRNMNMTEDVPVFAILFGQASEEQLTKITEFSSGRIFDGQKDLVKAFRQAKGYN